MKQHSTCLATNGLKGLGTALALPMFGSRCCRFGHGPKPRP